MHCKGMNQVSFICIILLLYFRKQILSQHQQESVYLEKVMFSMEKHYTHLDSEARRDYQSTRNQIKKQVLISLCIHLFRCCYPKLLTNVEHHKQFVIIPAIFIGFIKN